MQSYGKKLLLVLHVPRHSCYRNGKVKRNCMIISAHFLSTRESWVLGLTVPVTVGTSSLSLSLAFTSSIWAIRLSENKPGWENNCVLHLGIKILKNEKMWEGNLENNSMWKGKLKRKKRKKKDLHVHVHTLLCPKQIRQNLTERTGTDRKSQVNHSLEHAHGKKALPLLAFVGSTFDHGRNWHHGDRCTISCYGKPPK